MRYCYHNNKPYRKGAIIMTILTVLAAVFYLPLYILAKLCRRYS